MDNDKDIFVELAKVRSEQRPIEIDTEEEETEIEPQEEDEKMEETDEFDIGEESEGQLTVDVYKDDKENIVVQSAVAGVDPEELEVNITNESVTIRGRREKVQRVEEKDYFYQECFWGRFSRSIILPVEVDPEKSTAALKNGVLTVKMPAASRRKAKKLKVKMD